MKVDFEEYRNASKRAPEEPRRKARQPAYDQHSYDGSDPDAGEVAWMLCAKRTSDGRAKMIECEDTGELKVLLCGKTISGEILPILVDEDGAVITTSA
jgi:hypothetical protein